MFAVIIPSEVYHSGKKVVRAVFASKMTAEKFNELEWGDQGIVVQYNDPIALANLLYDTWETES